MPINIGRLDKRVSLANAPIASPSITDGEGGYTETFVALSPATVWASIQPAPAREVEELFSNTVAAVTSHLVGVRYHSGITTKTRVTFVDGNSASHALFVRGIQNPDMRSEQLILACEEVIA